jgi:hypothetical protein
MRLEMGEDLTHIIRGGTVRPIAPMEEVQSLQVMLWPATRAHIIAGDN